MFVAHLGHAPPGIRIQDWDHYCWYLGAGTEGETSKEMGIGGNSERIASRNQVTVMPLALPVRVFRLCWIWVNGLPFGLALIYKS